MVKTALFMKNNTRRHFIANMISVTSNEWDGFHWFRIVADVTISINERALLSVKQSYISFTAGLDIKKSWIPHDK